MKHRRSLFTGTRLRRAVTVSAAFGMVILIAVGFTWYSTGRDDATPENAAQAGTTLPAPDGQLPSVQSIPPSAATASAPVSASASVPPSKKPANEATTKAAPKGDCALPAYPTASCTGVPAGWSPQKTVQGDLTVTKAGTVVSDQLVTGSILVRAADVTIRRTRVYGTIDNFIGDKIYGHLTIEDTEVVPKPGEGISSVQQYAFGVANYTCRRCKVMNRMEGWRVGAGSFAGAGQVVIEDSYAQLAVPAGMCASSDPHGDGIQGYGGPTATIRHNTIDQRGDDCPTSPIFIPDQDNAGGTVTDNVLAGGGYALRLSGGSFPTVTGNKIVTKSAEYGPIDVDCAKIGTWSGNAEVTFDFDRGVVLKETKKLNNC
ncbi:right-handed parallel beta-helix repeat-containing protein [Actinoplanes philippinensis]|uniref:right-handed parallel beta-helix repeat-containing protein n=1 Tax=Actinoplanes philippinensis TaxID=35752 RepID=UPI0033C43F07